jgi:hypothetical protein
MQKLSMVPDKECQDYFPPPLYNHLVSEFIQLGLMLPLDQQCVALRLLTFIVTMLSIIDSRP